MASGMSCRASRTVLSVRYARFQDSGYVVVSLGVSRDFGRSLKMRCDLCRLCILLGTVRELREFLPWRLVRIWVGIMQGESTWWVSVEHLVQGRGSSNGPLLRLFPLYYTHILEQKDEVITLAYPWLSPLITTHEG